MPSGRAGGSRVSRWACPSGWRHLSWWSGCASGRARPSMPTDPAAASPVAGLAAGMGIVLALAGVAAAEGWVARRLGSVGSRVLPGSEIFWRRASHLAMVSGVGFGTQAMWGRAMRSIEAGTAKFDEGMDDLGRRRVDQPADQR